MLLCSSLLGRDMLKTIVVVPCYNEAKRLDLQAFEMAIKESPEVGLLFVNDGSQDETLSLITCFAKKYPRQVGVLSDNVNRGKASAVRRGLSVAITCRPDYVGFWDADLATPLSEIADFCQILDDRDNVSAVVGTRLPLLGHQIERKASRQILSRMFATAASIVLGVSLRDTQCGAKMFRVDQGIDSIFEAPFYSKWIFDVEIFARMIAKQKLTTDAVFAETIYEKPLESWFEVPGSKLKIRDFAKAVYELGMIYWKYLGPFRRPKLSQLVDSPTIPVGMFRNDMPLQVAAWKHQAAA